MVQIFAVLLFVLNLKLYECISHLRLCFIVAGLQHVLLLYCCSCLMPVNSVSLIFIALKKWCSHELVFTNESLESWKSWCVVYVNLLHVPRTFPLLLINVCCISQELTLTLYQFYTLFLQDFANIILVLHFYRFKCIRNNMFE